AVSGWAKKGISLKKPKRLRTAANGEENRLGKGLRKELETCGETRKRPEDLLSERLPSSTVTAWHERQCNDLAKLRTRIAYLVEHDVSEPSSREVHPDPSVHAAWQPRQDPIRDNPTYEEISRKLEEEDQYFAWLSKEAHLAPLEAEVTRLKFQEPPREYLGDHFTEQEIADMISRSRGTVTSLGSVKQAW